MAPGLLASAIPSVRIAVFLGRGDSTAGRRSPKAERPSSSRMAEIMRRRIAAGAAVVGLGVGILGASPAWADRDDKAAKDVVHLLCGIPELREAVAEDLGVKANRGQCQKALRALLDDGGDA